MIIPVLYDNCSRLKTSILRMNPRTKLIYSKFFMAILEIFLMEGYINSYSPVDMVSSTGRIVRMHINVTFSESSKLLLGLKIISKPSRRTYVGPKDFFLKNKLIGDQLMILSTSHGILDHRQCLKKNIGGELLLTINRKC